MPKVSVIVPIYGVEKYIERCARSLFEQSIKDIEYIFVDDCSPDNSINILNRVLGDYPMRKSQTIIHRMDKNSGQALVRKWGIDHATGDYITHCDSDDWVDKQLYEKMYDASENGSADIIICDYEMTNGIKSKFYSGGKCHEPNECLERMMNHNMPWPLWNKIIKRSLFLNPYYYPECNMGEDLCICLQMFYYAKSVKYIKGFKYYYFINQSSIARSTSESKCISKFHDLEKNINVTLDFYRDKYQSPAIKGGLYFLDFYKYELLASVKNAPFYLSKYKKAVKNKVPKLLLNNYLPIKKRLQLFVLFVKAFV